MTRVLGFEHIKLVLKLICFALVDGIFNVSNMISLMSLNVHLLPRRLVVHLVSELFRLLAFGLLPLVVLV